MKTRWIFQSRISKTSHQRPAPHSGTPARQGPSREATLSGPSPASAPDAVERTMADLGDAVSQQHRRDHQHHAQRKAQRHHTNHPEHHGGGEAEPEPGGPLMITRNRPLMIAI